MANKMPDPKSNPTSDHEALFRDFSAEDRRLLNELHELTSHISSHPPRDHGAHSSTSPFANGMPSATSPFTAFKRLVDHQFESLVGTFQAPFARPSHNPSQPRGLDHGSPSELGVDRLWYGCPEQSTSEILSKLNGMSKETEEQIAAQVKSRLTLAAASNWDTPRQLITSLFRDDSQDTPKQDEMADSMLAYGGAFYFLPETGDKLPVSPLGGRQALPSPPWLSSLWFQLSPYSPIRLEAHPSLGSESARWRAAFEDLIDASLEQPMYSFWQRRQIPETDTVPGSQWLNLLHGDGSLPPLLPRFYNTPEGRSEYPARLIPQILRGELKLSRDHPFWRDFDELCTDAAIAEGVSRSQLTPSHRPTTEPENNDNESLSDWLDRARAFGQHAQNQLAEFEEQFATLRLQAGLSDQDPQPNNKSHPETSPTEPPASKTPPSSSPTPTNVLSHLTTTTTTRLPDGTITTKVVLRKRFADGSEHTESSETTSHAPPSPHDTPRHVDVSVSPENKPSRGKGWFWSS